MRNQTLANVTWADASQPTNRPSTRVEVIVGRPGDLPRFKAVAYTRERGRFVDLMIESQLGRPSFHTVRAFEARHLLDALSEALGVTKAA